MAATNHEENPIIDLKTFAQVTIKNAEQGTVTAVISTFDVLDRDGDVVRPGAIRAGTEVVLSAYGHKSWDGTLPVGRGVIRTTPTEAIVDGQFFLETTAGRDAFGTVKGLGSLQEWSYSLQDITAETGLFNGKTARIISRVGTIKEVSPVLMGAGLNTRTLFFRKVRLWLRELLARPRPRL